MSSQTLANLAYLLQETESRIWKSSCDKDRRGLSSNPKLIFKDKYKTNILSKLSCSNYKITYNIPCNTVFAFFWFHLVRVILVVGNSLIRNIYKDIGYAKPSTDCFHFDLSNNIVCDDLQPFYKSLKDKLEFYCHNSMKKRIFDFNPKRPRYFV